jgi:hypothetical protein
MKGVGYHYELGSKVLADLFPLVTNGFLGGKKGFILFRGEWTTIYLGVEVVGPSQAALGLRSPKFGHLVFNCSPIAAAVLVNSIF